MTMQRLCALDELTPGLGREFTLESDEGAAEAFVLRQGDGVVAYLNRCPHIGVGLNWKPGHYLDPKGQVIECAMHGAQFRIEDGACLRGMCHGEGLEPVAVELRGVEVWVPTELPPTC